MLWPAGTEWSRRYHRPAINSEVLLFMVTPMSGTRGNGIHETLRHKILKNCTEGERSICNMERLLAGCPEIL